MKNIIKIFGINLLLILSACEKENLDTTQMGSLNVVNVIAGGATVRMADSRFDISNNGNTQLSLLAGERNVYIYPVADSLKPYYNNSVEVNEGDIYTLFLAGTNVQADAILIKENIPFIKDSLVGVRFINLSPNSTAISINITGNANGSEASSLSYKEKTDFKFYPGTSSVTGYSFQIRDAVTGNLLTTYTLSQSSMPRFANITLAIRGLVSGTPALGVTRINHDR